MRAASWILAISLLMVTSAGAQSCPAEPPFPNTNDMNAIMKACTDYGGTWSGGIRGGCTFPPDWCHKGTAASSGLSMPVPANSQQFGTELLGAAANVYFTGLANKLKEDAARAQQKKLEAAQQAQQQALQQQQQRQALVQRLTAGSSSPDQLHLEFDDSALGVSRNTAPGGDLKLVFDDSALGVKHTADATAAPASFGIQGLPGIYLNGAGDGKGSSAPYGIKGLPGVYTGGPSQAQPAAKSNPTNAGSGYGIPGLPGVYTGGSGSTPATGGYGIPGLPGTNTGGPAATSNAAPASATAAPPATTGEAAPTPVAAVSGPSVDKANDIATRQNAATPASTPSGVPVPANGDPNGAATTSANPKLGELNGKSAGLAQGMADQLPSGSDEKQSEKARNGFDTKMTWGNGPAPVGPVSVDTTIPASATSTPEVPQKADASQSAQPNTTRVAGNRQTTSPTTVTAAPANVADVNPGEAHPASRIPQPSDPDYLQKTTLNRSGIYPGHGDAICRAVQQKHAVTIFQHVTAVGRDLIAEGQTVYKPMELKAAKSSSMPRISGMVPRNPCYSKRADTVRAELIDPANCMQELENPASTAYRPKLARKLHEHQDETEQCVKSGKCTWREFGGVEVLADAKGKFFVSDPDPYIFLFPGQTGAVVNDPRFGMVTPEDRDLALAINTEAHQDVIMNGTEFRYGRNGAKFPLTAFAPGEKSCRTWTIKNEAELQRFYADMAREGYHVPAITPAVGQ